MGVRSSPLMSETISLPLQHRETSRGRLGVARLPETSVPSGVPYPIRLKIPGIRIVSLVAGGMYGIFIDLHWYLTKIIPGHSTLLMSMGRSTSGVGHPGHRCLYCLTLLEQVHLMVQVTHWKATDSLNLPKAPECRCDLTFLLYFAPSRPQISLLYLNILTPIALSLDVDGCILPPSIQPRPCGHLRPGEDLSSLYHPSWTNRLQRPPQSKLNVDGAS